jgi:hypothetical protein
MWFPEFVDVDEFADIEVDESFYPKDIDIDKIEDAVDEAMWNTHFDGSTEVEVIPRKSLKVLITEHEQYQQYVCAGAFQACRLRKWETEQKAKQVYRDQLIARGIIRPAATAVVAVSTATQSIDKEKSQWQQSHRSQ